MRQKVGNENSAWKCQALENSNWVVLSTLSLMSWVRRAWLSGQHTLGFGLQTGQSGQPSDRGTQKPIQSQCATRGSQAACQVCCCPLTDLYEEVNAGPEVPNALLRGCREISCPHLSAFIFRTNLP